MAQELSQSVQKREELLRLLSDNPSDSRSRVALAKTYFEDGYYDFCLRELRDLKIDSEEAKSLIGRIRKYLGDYSGEEEGREQKPEGLASKTIAEIEI